MWSSRFGSSHPPDEIRQPLRLVVVAATGEDGKPYALWLLTDRLEMAADLVALGDRHRWSMVQFYFLGWATAEELERHIQKQLARQERTAAKKR